VVVNDFGGSTFGEGSDTGPAEDVAAEIRAGGGAAVADGGDVADVATGERLVETAVREFGKLDIVLNAAGILRDGMIFNLSESDWDDVIRVHLKGHFSTVRPASRYFRERRDPEGNFRIINFTSGSGLEGSPGQPNYAAAKMGIVGLTYSLAQGLARYGVTANAIAPAADTRMTTSVPAEKRLRPFGTPERAAVNVAPVAVYLASERSAWLTGRTLHSAGYGVGLYSNPEQVRRVVSTEPWDQEQLAAILEGTFRPVADGLPRSVFAEQMKTL
jgi:NAD(P)-dependent dehydrogenase (short-subunit alcohol dehydrogenase family)